MIEIEPIRVDDCRAGDVIEAGRITHFAYHCYRADGLRAYSIRVDADLIRHEYGLSILVPDYSVRIQGRALARKFALPKLRDDAEAFTDRVPYCVVKRNCPGPSILQHDERPHSRVAGPRWKCQHCGGFAMAQDDDTPPFRRKIEP